MNAVEVADALERLTEPSRLIDRRIADTVGFSKVDAGKNILWKDPTGETMRKLPFFTQSIDDALTLIALTCPAYQGGVCWSAESGAAIIGSGDRYEAKSPAIAICLAAMMGLAVARKE